MPKTDIIYSNTLVYKICCKDPTITDCYVGHTTNKAKRKQNHKKSCNNPNDKSYNLYVYRFIRNNGGFDNWEFIVLEEFSCENRNQAELRERYWLETLCASLNKIIPTRTKKEWNEENRENIKESKKKYYKDNKERLNKKIDCDCGGSYDSYHRARHFKTAKHINYLNS
jgi:hypothetical protein